MVKAGFSVLGYQHYGLRLFMINAYAMLMLYLAIATFILSVALTALLYTNVEDTIGYWMDKIKRKNSKEAARLEKIGYFGKAKYVFIKFYDINSFSQLIL